MDTPFKIKRPKALPDYILKNCAKETYLIYDRKEDTCVCTRCGSVKKISEMNDGEYLKHNAKHWCYECGDVAICKDQRYGRKNITDYGRILFFTRHGRTTYAQLDEYIIDYNKLMIPSVSVYAVAQYKFNKDEQIYYKYKFAGFFNEEDWELKKRIKIPSPYGAMGCYYPKFEDTYFYEPTRKHVGTDLKYANLEMKRLGYNPLFSWEPDWLIRYINAFLKYPSIEILEKSGFERIVSERAFERGCRAINWRTSDLRKILKSDNGDIKEMRRLKVSVKDIECIKKVRKEFPNLSIENCIKASQIFNIYNNWRFKSIKETVAELPVKLAKDKALKYLFSQTVTYIEYKDYLEECNKLGMDLKNKKVLFPKDLKKAHKETAQKIILAGDELIEKNFKRFTKKITGMIEPYYFGEYLIRPAENPAELRNESKVLSHCVRTYAEKVANGKTSILFIRKIDSPDEPLFTLELNKEHRVVQCRGKHNCSYPEEVQEVIDHWLKDVINKKPKKSRQAA